MTDNIEFSLVGQYTLIGDVILDPIPLFPSGEVVKKLTEATPAPDSLE